MRNEIHVWELKGLIYLNNIFIKSYEKRLKDYGVGKLADEMNVDYNTITIYRRNKPINIRLLERICEKLGINKIHAEESIIKFTQNLKTKYDIKFPIKIDPLSLRAVSMIIGDGSTEATFSVWSQHHKNIHYGVELLKQTVNYEPPIRGPISGNKNCKVISIPKFLVDIIAKETDCHNFKSEKFFDKICKLPRNWRFQVFAQLVVDEGSPDNSFMIHQSSEDIRHGIMKLSNSLGYNFTQAKRGVYINTESIPEIEKDWKGAKQEFGYLGGFWFKDERFERACRLVDPKLSENMRLADKKFESALEIIAS